MSLISFLRQADYLATIFVNVVVIVFSISAYRLTRMRAFGFLIVAGLIGVISGCALQIVRQQGISALDSLTFSKFYRTGYLISSVCWGIGTFQLIQFVRRTSKPDDKIVANTELRSTRVVPPASGISCNPETAGESSSDSGGDGS